MGGDAMPMLANVAGRVLGVLSALPSRGGGFSNLANYMAARGRAMSDPNARAALTPFGAGFYQIGGDVRPTTVAQPRDFLGPPAPGPSVWQPNLPALAPEAALQEQAAAQTRAGLMSPDIITRARAKQDARIPLTAEETNALIAAGADIRRAAGADSSVTIGPGGTTVTLGQPGLPPGVVQTPPAGEMPREQLPLLPGQVPQFTGRYNANGQPLYTAVTPPKVDERPATLPPLPTPQPPAPTVTAPPPAPAPVTPAPTPPAPVVQTAPPPPPPPPKPVTPPPPIEPPPTWDPNAVVPHVVVPAEPPPGRVGYPSPAFAAVGPPDVNVAAGVPAPPTSTTVTPTTGGPPAGGQQAALPVYPAAGFVFHHSGGSTLDSLRETLKKRGLGSQYLMDRDGTIYSFAGAGSPHIRPNDQFGGIAPGLSNRNAVGMEIVAKNDQDVTPAQVASARRFIAANYGNVPVYGHGEVNPGHKQADEGMTVVNAIRGERGGPVVAAPSGRVDLNAPVFRQIEATRNPPLPPGTLSGMAEQESGGDPNAAAKTTSARGLFQITKDTARSWGISANDRYDPIRSAVATADQLAKRAQTVGLARAIGMHYGGPGADFTQPINGLSPAQYAASVYQKSQKYAPGPDDLGLVAFPSPAFGAEPRAPGGAPVAVAPAVVAPVPVRPAPLLGQAPVTPTGYDLASAQAAGMTPNQTPGPNYLHMGSRSPAFISPAGIPEGLMLKGTEHPTERLGLEGERAYGNIVVIRNGRQVSIPPWELLPTERPIDMVPQLLGGMPPAANVAVVPAGQLGLIAPKEPGLVAFASPAPTEPGAAKQPSTTVPLMQLPPVAPIAPPAISPTAPAAPGPVPGPGGTTLEGVSKTSQEGETRTFAPPSAADIDKWGILRKLNITDPRNMTPAQAVEVERETLAQKQRAAAATARGERLERPTPEGLAKSNEALVMYRNAMNRFDEQFPDPEEHKKFIGEGKMAWENFWSRFREPDRRWEEFHKALAPFGTKAFQDAGAALSPQEYALVMPNIPTGEEKSWTEFEVKRQNFRDSLDDVLAWRDVTRNLPAEQVTGALMNDFFEDRARQRFAARLTAGQPGGEQDPRRVVVIQPPAPVPVPPAAAAPPPPPPAAPAWEPTWVR